MNTVRPKRPQFECLCGSTEFSLWHSYSEPPEGEIKFPFSKGDYKRDLHHCRNCGHIISIHDMDMTAVYSGDYVDSTYGDSDGMRQTFDRIISFPPAESDNYGRVHFINSVAARHFGDGDQNRAPTGKKLLDIGAGLGVFPYAMTKCDWDCAAIDPDPRAAKHINDVAGIVAWAGEFQEFTESQIGKFDVITFNKVLEHVVSPVSLLTHSRYFLSDTGFVYIELPDVTAADDGPNREEFFIDHHHVFSAQSIAGLVERSGFRLMALERLREPSSKYTLRAVAVPTLEN